MSHDTMRSPSVYSWMMWLGLFIVTNHFRTGASLRCHGPCWENVDGPSLYTNNLMQGAPKCDLSKLPDLDCSGPAYTGCMKQRFTVTEPEAMEFTLYECDQSVSPIGCDQRSDNRQNYKSTVANYKCTSDLCNKPGSKSCEGGTNSTALGKDSGASCTRPVKVFWMSAFVLWIVLAFSWLLLT